MKTRYIVTDFYNSRVMQNLLQGFDLYLELLHKAHLVYSYQNHFFSHLYKK